MRGMGTGLLPDALLRELYNAAIAAGLDRRSLVASLDRSLIATFSAGRTSGERLWHDLSGLNGIASLEDGSVPIRTWLQTARLLAGPRRETAVFERALDGVCEVLSPRTEAIDRGNKKTRSCAPSLSTPWSSRWRSSGDVGDSGVR